MDTNDETLPQALGEIEKALSERTHALANALNDIFLQVACLQDALPEPYRTTLANVRKISPTASEALHGIRSIRDRIGNLRNQCSP